MSSLDKLQFDNLLTQVIEQGASDLYLSMGNPPMFKIADQLVPASQDILTAVKIEEFVFPLITPEQKSLLIKEKALVFSHTFASGLRFKINLFYQKGSLAASLRFIPPNIRTIKEIGLPKQVERIFDLESGLIIIAGPVSSGKTVTTVALIEHLNTHKQLRIVTLEKPIEFIFVNKKSIIQQREIGSDTPSFLEGLTDCLETDLNVIVVSQIESREEAEKVLELAQQGRLVIINLTADSVLAAITKLIAFFDDSEQGRIRAILSQVLQAIICQKLIPGAPDKNKGLIVVPEILFQTNAVRNSIQDNKLDQIKNILRISAKQGMVSFEQSLASLVKQGEIAEKEALEYVADKEEFKQMLNA